MIKAINNLVIFVRVEGICGMYEDFFEILSLSALVSSHSSLRIKRFSRTTGI